MVDCLQRSEAERADRQAYRQNLDVRTAGTHPRGRAPNVAAGNLFPQLQEAFGDVSRAISGSAQNLPPAISRFFDDYAVGLNLNWEIISGADSGAASRRPTANSTRPSRTMTTPSSS